MCCIFLGRTVSSKAQPKPGTENFPNVDHLLSFIKLCIEYLDLYKVKFCNKFSYNMSLT